MNKLLLAFCSVFLLGTFSAGAYEVVTQTRFEGNRITGVKANGTFQIKLVKAADTKAVVEISENLENYLLFSRDDNGIVSVSLRSMTNAERREYNRLPHEELTMRLTLYLPEVKTIELSGNTDLTTSDEWDGSGISAKFFDYASMQSFVFTGSNLELECGGTTRVAFTLNFSGSSIVAKTTGSANVNLTASAVTTSKLSATGASTLRIVGDGDQGEWNTNGSARIVGDEFTIKEISIVATGSSSVRANVSESLSTQTSGSASVRYIGQPKRFKSVSGASSVQWL